MVPLNELRIGSNYKANGQIFLMDMKMMWAFTGGTSPYIIDNLEPIPLTPQILRGLEFSYRAPGISGADMWQGMGFWTKDDLCLRGNVSSAGRGSLCLSGYFNSNVSSLHHLQNLYYQLYGEELTYKPE